MEEKKKSDLYNIGAVFPAESKSGTRYLSGWVFRDSQEEDNLKVFLFPKESKSGKKYYSVNVSMLEGETQSQLLERIERKMSSHATAEANRAKDFRAKTVRKSEDTVDLNDLPF